MTAGADACLPKPLDPERLLAELGLAPGEAQGVD
jgi:DNA-binding response OmpR family regulator